MTAIPQKSSIVYVTQTAGVLARLATWLRGWQRSSQRASAQGVEIWRFVIFTNIH